MHVSLRQREILVLQVFSHKLKYSLVKGSCRRAVQIMEQSSINHYMSRTIPNYCPHFFFS